MTPALSHVGRRNFPTSGRLRTAAVFLLLAAGCSHSQTPSDAYPRMEPVRVRVKNENFLDMNVALVASGVSRRLGMVAGNSGGDFRVEWSMVNGQSVSLTATPIGGRGSAMTGSLNVGPGQVIDFKVGSVLRQSTASVHDP